MQLCGRRRLEEERQSASWKEKKARKSPRGRLEAPTDAVVCVVLETACGRGRSGDAAAHAVVTEMQRRPQRDFDSEGADYVMLWQMADALRVGALGGKERRRRRRPDRQGGQAWSGVFRRACLIVTGWQAPVEKPSGRNTRR